MEARFDANVRLVTGVDPNEEEEEEGRRRTTKRERRKPRNSVVHA